MHLSCFLFKGVLNFKTHLPFICFVTYMYNISKYTSNQLLSPITEVQLEGPALVPSFNSTSSKETLLRRHVKHYNHQVGFLVGQSLSGVFWQKVAIFVGEPKKNGSQIFLEYVFWLRIGVFLSNIQVTKLSPSPKLLGRWIFLIQSRWGEELFKLENPGLSNPTVPRAP